MAQREAGMIRIMPPGAGLVQRLRARTERIAAARAASVRRSLRGAGPDWRSATDLWPDIFSGD